MLQILVDFFFHSPTNVVNLIDKSYEFIQRYGSICPGLNAFMILIVVAPYNFESLGSLRNQQGQLRQHTHSHVYTTSKFSSSVTPLSSSSRASLAGRSVSYDVRSKFVRKRKEGCENFKWVTAEGSCNVLLCNVWCGHATVYNNDGRGERASSELLRSITYPFTTFRTILHVFAWIECCASVFRIIQLTNQETVISPETPTTSVILGNVRWKHISEVPRQHGAVWSS